MEAHALDPHSPATAASLGVRPARDVKSDARRQAFEQAMQRRAAKVAPASDAQPKATATTPEQPAGLHAGHDGLVHVDLLV